MSEAIQTPDEIVEEVSSFSDSSDAKKGRKKSGIVGINYKNVAFLLQILGDRAMIPSSRITKFRPRDQKKLALAIKRARFLGLLPYVN